ncbi:alpha-(1,3)-fucosyltransferase 7-like [Dunckerocampus dactyliophorus]|uniref:alpha-(1,3)-fucosyltransferase 7-like n=1 Tax=Dunckerocampus dactyliophorus TaxID=161453 RepID=UPI00240501ED|nr:alpha-(1,3)-fucosyltransferase 7-like [Dunckerocampus dactyliophorus]
MTKWLQEYNDSKKGTPASVKKYLLFYVLCIIVFVLNAWLRASWSPVAFIFTNSNHTTQIQPNVTVLLWYWPFNQVEDLHGDVCWDLYRIPRCRVVAERSSFSEADVVVFHNRELVTGKEKLPLELPRPPGQRWAWLSLESPANNGDLRRFAGVFNLTVSYRRDADVSTPYGKLLPRASEEPVNDIPQNKTDLVCWVVSNYRRSYRRSKVYQKLSTVVPVKVYGRWTNTPLKPKDLLPTISRCYFYLAFENSISKDYITEKLWRNAYQSGAVPVVLGPPVQDYEAVAAPHSFIHVDKFPSAKVLGKYLQKLAGDAERYGKYQRWRREWKAKSYEGWRWVLCQICVQYHSFPRHKVYADLAAWDGTATT